MQSFVQVDSYAERTRQAALDRVYRFFLHTSNLMARPRHLALLIALLLTACSAPDERTRNAPAQPEAGAEMAASEVGDVRVATFNTEFLFDGRGDEGRVSFDRSGDAHNARLHRQRVARVIRSLDADVVMLQEVEDEAIVQTMIEEDLSGLGYRAYFVQGKDTFTGQDVALISRLPVESVGRTDERAPLAGSPGDDYGVSKNMYARMEIAGEPATLVGLHFLAYPLAEDRLPRREAQAEVIRRFVAEETAAGRDVIVLGDFNDYEESTLDVSGTAPITDVLATIRAAGPSPEDDLRNVIALAPDSARYSSHWDKDDDRRIDEGELTAIDHVLLSPDLWARIDTVEYVHGHDTNLVSDHFPIVVEFDGAARN